MLDDITSDQLDNLESKRSFRLCGVLSEIERRYTKKDAKPWARFTLIAKEKDFSIPMFPEAFEQYGLHLEEGKIVVMEGVASKKDGELRTNVTNVRPVEDAISSLTEEVTWLLDPDHRGAEQFTKDMFALGEKGEGGTLIRLAYARNGEDEGLVVETDSRFSMRFFRVCRQQNMIRFLLLNVLGWRGSVAGRWFVFATVQVCPLVFEVSDDVQCQQLGC